MTVRFAAGFVAASLVGLGCSSGPGPLVTAVSTTRDDPGSTRDVPPDTRDNPVGACIVCDVNYDCTGPARTTFTGNGVQLSTAGGTCVKPLIDLLCSGALFNATSCSGGGGGPFTCGDTTCSPTSQGNTTVVTGPGSPPSSGIGGTSSSSSSGGPFIDGG